MKLSQFHFKAYYDIINLSLQIFTFCATKLKKFRLDKLKLCNGEKE